MSARQCPACHGAVKLRLQPITLREARAFVKRHHRHHRAPQGGLFAVAVSCCMVEGVAIIGKPVARLNDDSWTAEVTRLCTRGAPNACSMLYAAAWRAARALGYRRLLTYTLASESGDGFTAAEVESALSAADAIAYGERGGRRRRECWEADGAFARCELHPWQWEG